jgi:RNA polymerase sigma factor (sigma-70 family)
MSATRSDPSPAVSRFFTEASAFEPLPREREQSLARRSDRSARDELVRCNLGFVAMIAREFHPCGVPFEDLLHEGSLGLIEAARRFDAGRGVKFITYARWWIRKEILRALGEQSTLVSVPDHRRRMLRRMHLERESLERRMGRRLEWEDVVNHSSRSRSEVDRILEAEHQEVSVHAAGPGDSLSLSERLADTRTPSAEEEVIRLEMTERMEEALGRLSDRQRRVLCARFGLGGHPVLTLRELGLLEGVSRERARQIEQEGLLRLRKLMHRRRPLSRPLERGYGLVTNGERSDVERRAC